MKKLILKKIDQFISYIVLTHTYSRWKKTKKIDHIICIESLRRNKALIAELNKPNPGSRELDFPRRYSQSFFNQCKACLWKQQLSYSRNPPYIAVRLMFTTFIALMLGTIFWDLGSKRYACRDGTRILC